MQQREQRYRDNNSQTIKNRNRKRSHRRKKRKRLQRTGWILCIVMIGLIINGFGGPAELIENAFQKYFQSVCIGRSRYTRRYRASLSNISSCVCGIST